MTRIGFLILAASIPLFASDVITLRDGSQRHGTFISGSDRTITFEENGARRQYDLSQIQSLQFDPSVAYRNTARTGSFGYRGPIAAPRGATSSMRLRSAAVRVIFMAAAFCSR